MLPNYRIIFPDSFRNWNFKLITDEHLYNEDIEDLIKHYINVVYEDDIYSHNPTGIMDALCEDKGWEWEDGDIDDIVIYNWERKGT